MSTADRFLQFALRPTESASEAGDVASLCDQVRELPRGLREPDRPDPSDLSQVRAGARKRVGPLSAKVPPDAFGFGLWYHKTLRGGPPHRAPALF